MKNYNYLSKLSMTRPGAIENGLAPKKKEAEKLRSEEKKERTKIGLAPFFAREVVRRRGKVVRSVWGEHEVRPYEAEMTVSKSSTNVGANLVFAR